MADPQIALPYVPKDGIFRLKDLPADAITEFRGQYWDLSNFAKRPVRIKFKEGYEIVFPSTEHAFVANKITDESERRHIATIVEPRDARTYGRTVKLRPDWEDIKDRVMDRLTLIKASQHPDVGALVDSTGDRILVEGTNWNDTTWGVDLKKGYGQNRLGLSWMRTRAVRLERRLASEQTLDRGEPEARRERDEDLMAYLMSRIS